MWFSLAIDKLCDQISDAILDACLSQDPLSRVACETAAMTGMVVVFGEITSNAVVDFQKIARETIERIGYDDSSKGTVSKSFTKSSLVIPGVRIGLQDLQCDGFHPSAKSRN